LSRIPGKFPAGFHHILDLISQQKLNSDYMKKSSSMFIFGTVWEIIRFFLFFLLAVLIFNKSMTVRRFELLWFILISAGQLMVPGGYLLIYFFPEKYGSMTRLLSIGKVLNLFSAALFIFDGLFSERISQATINLPFVQIPYLIILVLAIFFDLIFLYFLLSYKLGANLPQGRDNELGTTPDTQQ
jgi:hypothetical protein